MTGSIYNWSTTAASNANSDGDINFAEGQAPSTLNNSARQVMARVAEYIADNGGALIAGGTANALSVTSNSAITAYQDTLTLALRIATDNTAAATLNLNLLGAKSIRKMVAAGESALTGAELQADGIYLFRYSAALNAAAGGWLLLNPTIDAPNFVTLTGAQILTNKTLTSPTINTPTIATPAMTNGTSSGMTLTTAIITQPTLTLKQSATPTPTAEGDIQWDSDDNALAIGDGAATQLFLPIPASTAAGDIEYYTAAKATARLAKGTARQILRMNAGATAPSWGDVTAIGTPIATTSGAFKEFTGIPSGVKRITIMIADLSTTGGSALGVQIGPVAGVETSGYAGAVQNSSPSIAAISTIAAFTDGSISSARNYVGVGTFTLLNSATNLWTFTLFCTDDSANRFFYCTGYKALAGILERIRLTTSGGVDTFDAGSVNILYE